MDIKVLIHNNHKINQEQNRGLIVSSVFIGFYLKGGAAGGAISCESAAAEIFQSADRGPLRVDVQNVLVSIQTSLMVCVFRLFNGTALGLWQVIMGTPVCEICYAKEAGG